MSGARRASMTPAERQQKILEHVMAEGQASATELADLTGKSAMTVHRDVEELAQRGLVRKFHGGVSALPTSVFESSSDFRMHRRGEEKAALARVAAEFVDPGSSVMLDDSTTVLALAALLVAQAPLTIVTNYVRILELARDKQDINLIMIGGRYSHTHDSFIGPPDQTNIDSYAVDIAFQSTSTMDTRMTYHQEQDVVSMKRVQLRTGRRRVLLMDGSKVGHTSLLRYAPISDFTDVVLTDDVPQDVVDAIAEVATVHIAAVHPS